MRDEWDRYKTAMREIGLAFHVAVMCKEKNGRLDVTFRRDGLTPAENDALDVIEELVEVVSEFPPGYLERLEPPKAG